METECRWNGRREDAQYEDDTCLCNVATAAREHAATGEKFVFMAGPAL